MAEEPAGGDRTDSGNGLDEILRRINPPERLDFPGGVLVRKRRRKGTVRARSGPDGQEPVSEEESEPNPPPLPPYPQQFCIANEYGKYPYQYFVVVYDDEPAYQIYKQAMQGDVQAQLLWAVIREIRLTPGSVPDDGNGRRDGVSTGTLYLDYDLAAVLVQLSKKRLQNVAVGDPPPAYSSGRVWEYSVLRPWLLKHWPNKSHRLPKSAGDAVEILKGNTLP